MRNKEHIISLIDRVRGDLFKEYFINNIALFGSYAINAQTEASDIDLLVEFDRNPGLIKFFDLQDYLSSILGTKVDLVTVKALKPIMREQILKEAIYI